MAMAVTREALLESVGAARLLALFDDRGRSGDAGGGGRLDPGLVVIARTWMATRSRSRRGTLGLIAWGLYWKPVRFTLAVAVLATLALWRYGADYALRHSDFWLKYFLESQARSCG
jgi:hypothetical protein